MNIRTALLEDKVQNHAKAQAVADYAVSSAARFKQLMRCFLDQDYRLAQRAAWSVSWAARKKPEMVQPHVKELVSQLSKTGVHPAVIRNSVRVLQTMNIPEPLHGELMQSCFTLIETHETPVAIKAFALTTLGKLAAIYPDIIPELKLLAESRLPHETAAFRQRAHKLFQALSKLPAHIQAAKAIK
ncbi:hypothetical protein [Deminuibacter soli]|uniref:HEAT repeat domain-containing protein n=1 Tax=Deminuibacter soli TaxID=2291815 RepID=A0A3E1NJJ2_9BACT|nr:hypothetical protein [Deminuibacter soli]RFM28100.1 hypothetical protein DXN05_11250 [Deminuibacter soli]